MPAAPYTEFWRFDFNSPKYSQPILAKYTECMHYGTSICQYIIRQIRTLSKIAKILYCLVSCITFNSLDLPIVTTKLGSQTKCPFVIDFLSCRLPCTSW